MHESKILQHLSLPHMVLNIQLDLLSIRSYIVSEVRMCVMNKDKGFHKDRSYSYEQGT